MANKFSASVQVLFDDQFLVISGDEMIQNLPTGAPGIADELGVVGVVKAPITLGNIGGRRPRCAQQLIPPSESLFLGQGSHYLSGNEQPQLTAGFPAFQVFKRSDWCSFHKNQAFTNVSCSSSTSNDHELITDNQ
mgnify:FL=1